MRKNLFYMINLKPIPIGVFETGFNLNKKEKEKLLSLQYDIAPNGAKISQDNFIFKNKNFKRIMTLFTKTMAEYTGKILEITNEFYITQSWATINKSKTGHHSHTHKASIFSLVFYPESEEENKIFFELGKSSIQEGFDFFYNTKKFNVYNSDMWNAPTKKGSIIIFPSYLRHYSTNEGKKIMIGANFFIKGKIGWKERKDYIEI